MSDDTNQAFFSVKNIATISLVNGKRVGIKFKKPLTAVLKSPWLWGDYKKSFQAGKRGVDHLSFSLEKPDEFIQYVRELQKR